jgi:hypothetical protein
MSRQALPEYTPGTPLVLTPPEISKEASEKVPPNPQTWPTIAIRHLSEEYPFVLEGTDVQPIIQKQQGEQGVALGAILVRSQPRQGPLKDTGRESRAPAPEQYAKTGLPLRTVMIPILIEDFELQPLDIFTTDEDEWYPLTEKRFSDIMFRPTPFVALDNAPPPGNIGDRTQVPPEMAFGYGARGGLTNTQYRTASAPSTLLESVLRRLDPSEIKQYFRSVGPDTMRFLPNRILEKMRRYTQREAPSGDDFVDVAHSVLPANVIRMKRRSDGHYDVVEISDSGYLPKKRLLSDLELRAEYDRKVKNLDQHLAEKNHDVVVTLRRDEDEREPLALDEVKPDLYELNQTGQAMVASSQGGFHRGRLFGRVREFNGTLSDVKVFSDGTLFGCQPTIVGDLVGPLDKVTVEEHREPVIGEWGCFVYQPDGGEPEVTVPCKVLAHKTLGQGPGIETPLKAFLVQPYLGGDAITICQQEGIDRIFSATGATDDSLASYVGAAVYYVPAAYIHLPLGRECSLQYDKDQFGSSVQAKVEKELVTWPVHNQAGRNDERGSITLSHQMDDSYKLEGSLFEPVTGKATIDGATDKDALFLLSILGFSLEGCRRMLDKARTIHRVVICNARPVQSVVTKTATYLASQEEIREFCGLLRTDLSKEAANFGESPTVDALLSLNFITPETINEFVEKIPVLQESEKVLAQMLFYSRVGLNEIPEPAVRSAMTALNQATESLEYLESYGRGGRAPSTVPGEKDETYQEV